MSEKQLKNYCPLLKKSCIGMDCAWHTSVLGNNPQTNEPLTESGCAVQFLPVLIIENAKASRTAGASVDSLRNESQERQRWFLKLINALNEAKGGLIGGLAQLTSGDDNGKI